MRSSAHNHVSLPHSQSFLSARDPQARILLVSFEPTPRELWDVPFAALLALAAITGAAFGLLPPVFPTEAERRGLPPFVAGLVLSAYFLCKFLSMHWLTSLLQRKALTIQRLLACALLLLAGSLACFGALQCIPKSQQLGFALASLSAAAAATSTTGIMKRYYNTASGSGRGLLLLESSAAAGAIAGPLFAGFLGTLSNFAAPFMAAAAITATMLLLVLILPTEAQPRFYEERMLPYMTYTGSMDLLKKTEVVALLLSTALGTAAITFLGATFGPFLQSTEQFGALTRGISFALLACGTFATKLMGLSSWLESINGTIAGLLAALLSLVLLACKTLLPDCFRALLGSWNVWAGVVTLGLSCALWENAAFPATMTAAGASFYHPEIFDLVIALLDAAQSLGAAAGPLLGGILTSLLSFEVSTGIFCFALVSVAVTLGVLSGVATYRAQQEDAFCSDDESFFSLV